MRLGGADGMLYAIRGIRLAPGALGYTGQIYSLSLMSGQPYPRTWIDFPSSLSSEDACLAYLEGLRWPNGFVCPSCGVASWPDPREPHPHDVQGLRAPEHGHGRDHLRQDQYAASGLAGRGLVPDQPEAGRERSRPATGARVGELPDRLGNAARFVGRWCGPIAIV